MGTLSDFYLIDLDFCPDSLERPDWKMGPDFGSLANSEIKRSLTRALSRLLTNRREKRRGQRSWIYRFRSRKQTPRWSLLAIPFEVPPTSSESLELGKEQFMRVAKLLDWDASNDVQRMTEHKDGLVLDFWYVAPGRESDTLRILLNARKVAKAYKILRDGSTYKSIHEDTKSIIKHISSLVKLLNRMGDDWYKLVSQQDGRTWVKFSSSIKNRILQNIDSLKTGTSCDLQCKDQLIRDLKIFSSKSFYALTNLNEKTWESRGNIPEKLLGSADLFTVTKSYLLLEKFRPLQEGLHEARTVAEVADAMKALALGQEGPNGYRPVPAGQCIQWPTQHIHLVRVWRNRLQEAMDSMEEVEAQAISASTEPGSKICLPVWRHRAKETLRELLQGPGHSLCSELLEPSEVK